MIGELRLNKPGDFKSHCSLHDVPTRWVEKRCVTISRRRR